MHEHLSIQCAMFICEFIPEKSPRYVRAWIILGEVSDQLRHGAAFGAAYVFALSLGMLHQENVAIAHVFDVDYADRSHPGVHRRQYPAHLGFACAIETGREFALVRCLETFTERQDPTIFSRVKLASGYL